MSSGARLSLCPIRALQVPLCALQTTCDQVLHSYQVLYSYAVVKSAAVRETAAQQNPGTAEQKTETVQV